MEGKRRKRAPRKIPYRSEEEYVQLASEKAEGMGFTFIGWSEHFKGATTKCMLVCPTHGKWGSTQWNNLMSKGTGCTKCKSMNSGQKIPDEKHIQAFFLTGNFHPDTKFSRSTRLTSQGTKSYWSVYCPTCKTTNTSLIGSLKAGHLPCGCGLHNQREAYISYIMNGAECLALKFGIAIDSDVRNRTQNRKSVYEVILKEIWEFPNAEKCRRAERACLRLLDRAILLKDEMVDGYMETTYPRNLDTIRYLYKKYGGFRKY